MPRRPPCKKDLCVFAGPYSLRRSLFVSTITIITLIAAASVWGQSNNRNLKSVWGPKYKAGQRSTTSERNTSRRDSLARLRHWNELAINASGLDHTPVAPGENRTFGEQVGPVRAARAMAIVHIAMFDAINAIEGKYLGIQTSSV